MKTKLIYLMLILATSCATPSFYQVHKVEPINNVLPENRYLVYDDENCKVYYNFWDESGDAGFRFYNKTDKPIYINMEESFFILNGIAYDYFKNRVFTKSYTSQKSIEGEVSANRGVIYDGFGMLQTSNFSANRSAGSSSSTGRSVSISESKLICVPSKTSKIIYEYTISNDIYRSNDLYRFPTKSQVKPVNFTLSNSPIVFSNKISYYVGNSDTLTAFENQFYVSEITNYPAFNANNSKAEIYQEDSNVSQEQPLKLASANKYYIRYIKTQNSSKH